MSPKKIISFIQNIKRVSLLSGKSINFIIISLFEYTLTFLIYCSDIALIKLRVPVKFSEYIQPIQLTDSILPTFIGNDVISMGLGVKHLVIDGMPEVLQYTTFNVTNLEKCVPALMRSISKLGLVCAQVVQGRLCYGDIGGPVVSPDTGKLLGIAISATDNECEVSQWQSFADIASYDQWIEGTIYVESRMRLNY